MSRTTTLQHFGTLKRNGWIKSLLLFFDRISILLPDYMYGRPQLIDPTLVEPLEDLGLLQILDPNDWIDERMTARLAEAMDGLLSNGVFDNLPEARYLQGLSQSRIGYGANVDLAESLVETLKAKGLAKDSEDGVSHSAPPDSADHHFGHPWATIACSRPGTRFKRPSHHARTQGDT